MLLLTAIIAVCLAIKLINRSFDKTIMHSRIKEYYIGLGIVSDYVIGIILHQGMLFSVGYFKENTE